jgi:hypothetical protein
MGFARLPGELIRQQLDLLHVTVNNSLIREMGSGPKSRILRSWEEGSLASHFSFNS